MAHGAVAMWFREPLPAEPADRVLVREVLGGAPDRFELLVRRHRARLRRVVQGVVRDRAEAEDVVQQTLLRAFAGLGGWSGAAPFAMWLTRIAVNEARMRARRTRRLERVEIQLQRHAESPWLTPEQLAASREEVARVGAALPLLPARYREILQLTTLRELSHADVASRLGVSEGAVRVRLHRAREALRGLLAERGVSGPARTTPLVLAPARPGLIGDRGQEERRSA